MTKLLTALITSAVWLIQCSSVHSFAPPRLATGLSRTKRAIKYCDGSGRIQQQTILQASSEDRKDKFSMFQRIESIKTATVGLLSGGILATPFIALHDLPEYGAASWEFDTDMGSLQSALFAIVYRYCVREEDDNEMLNMGVV